MKRNFIAAGLQLFSVWAAAQATPGAPPPAFRNTFQETTFDHQIMLVDVNGRPLNRVASDVEGSPYLVERFTGSNIVLRNGQRFDAIPLRLDLERQELLYRSAPEREVVVAPGAVKELRFVDSATARPYRLQCGFPAIGTFAADTYYEVEAEGTVTLLRHRRKALVVTKNDLSGEVVKRYELTESFFVFTKQGMQPLKRDRNSVLALFDDEKAKVEAFAKDNRLGFKDVRDLARIIQYYNSLKVL